MHAGPAVGELKAASVTQGAHEQITAVKFSPTQELLWSGTDGGWLHASLMPEIERYSSVHAHQQRCADIVALPPSTGEGALSVSDKTIRVHSSGGVMQSASKVLEGGELACCAMDNRSPQAALGHASGHISAYDVTAGKVLSTAPVSEGITLLRAAAPKGLLAIGCTSGEVVLADPRQGFRVEQSVTAHTGALVAMDLSGSTLATSGLGTRQGQLVQDTIVKVYDLRFTARVLTTLPFSAGPALLRFHPRLSGTLLVASSNGNFMLAPTQGSPYSPVMQVDTEGDMLTAVDISSSGECFAFGGSGGFVHLWGYNQEPRVNLRSETLEVPSRAPKPEVSLEENDSFAAAQRFFPPEGKALSDWDQSLMGRPDWVPRVIDTSALQGAKQVDFVTYIPNPHFRRDRRGGEAAKLIAALRNNRLKPQTALKNGWQEGSRASSTAQSLLLPSKYRRVSITLDRDRRYEEFDFGRHNRTRFAGLENGIANCYANALVQVLYFVPSLRAWLLSLMPDASLEFSLLDELALLFRMLAGESGHACQATNLLRALRQSREATGLGLLEGHAQKGAHGADIEVEANKDRSLARRIQSLQRFLMDKLHHEAIKRHPNVDQSLLEASGGDGSTGGSPSAVSEQPEGKAGSRSVIKEIFGIQFRQRMQSLQGSRPVVDREAQAFQIDLQYPRRAKTPPPSPQKGTSSAPSAPAERPSFCEVLLASLKAESETRAWMSDALKYQYVKQSRTPLLWPQVLALGTGLQDRANLSFWQPVKPLDSLPGQPGEAPWAPWALSLELKDGEMHAREAPSLAELPSPNEKDHPSRAVYELTAVVALIAEEQIGGEDGKAALKEDEGHLVAHIRVRFAAESTESALTGPTKKFGFEERLPCHPGYADALPARLKKPKVPMKVPSSYMDKDIGLLPTPKARPPSPGMTPTTYFWPPQRFEPAPSLPENPFEGDDPFTDASGGDAQEQAGAAEEHGLPEDPFASDFASPQTPRADLDEQPILTPDKNAHARSQALGGVGEAAETRAKEGDQQAAGASVNEGSSTASPMLPLPEQFSGLTVSARRSDSLSRSSSMRKGSAGQEPTWLLINDFSISATAKSEVLDLLGGLKLPCLLYYTQVSEAEKDKRQDFQAMPAPVLSSQSFLRLCKAPPLQAELVGLSRLAGPSHSPLTEEEAPRSGMLLGLDAEFVAFSPPTKSLLGGVEVETAPSRLGLARVSVVRGEGAAAGTACIDDYIRTTEPVYDYLTQYSGLRPGDLDPTMSPNHLTTMKIAYLKLRYLVDAGCVFVGHGLKKDFRMINVVVPSAQIIDTVDLFYLKRQRKLSLRFLAAYLLKLDIQKQTHDSIEDARTAISLFKMYKKLQSERRLREVLQSMYAWGKQHGWDPAALIEHPATNIPSPVKADDAARSW